MLIVVPGRLLRRRPRGTRRVRILASLSDRPQAVKYTVTPKSFSSGSKCALRTTRSTRQCRSGISRSCAHRALARSFRLERKIPLLVAAHQEIDIAGDGVRCLSLRCVEFVWINRTRVEDVGLACPNRRVRRVQSRECVCKTGKLPCFCQTQLLASDRSRRSTKPGHCASMTGASPPISNSQSASIRSSCRSVRAGKLHQVADDAGLGPMNVVAAIAREIRAVAAVPCLDQQNVGIGEECGAGLRQQANERIVHAHGGSE